MKKKNKYKVTFSAFITNGSPEIIKTFEKDYYSYAISEKQAIRNVCLREKIKEEVIADIGLYKRWTEITDVQIVL